MSAAEKQVIFGILVVITAAGTFIGALVAAWRARAELGWTKIPAKMVYSTLGVPRVTGADVLYEYVHDGRRFHGKAVRSHEVGWAASTRARRDVRKYPAGSRIEIYVNPKDPAQAVIEPGGDKWFFALACTFSAGLAFAGVLFFEPRIMSTAVATDATQLELVSPVASNPVHATETATPRAKRNDGRSGEKMGDGSVSDATRSFPPAIQGSFASAAPLHEHSSIGGEDTVRIGIPFDTSESILRTCGDYSDGGDASCGRHFSTLARLKDETRDPSWASAMEKSIASIVHAQPGYRIRALECRSTACAVEIESAEYFDPYKFQVLSDRLSEVDSIRGYETSVATGVIKLRSVTFERRYFAK
jgi:hypothetical protein